MRVQAGMEAISLGSSEFANLRSIAFRKAIF
jgi:hypothetical protein